ncbi:hypothetical protein AKO1_003601 [Acrasis kona]|uniref:Uncharacterized protein n=1 Tax=Acrasis kona TaxID=1008807 RepID=A0AAW2Z5S5_9EUKA
MIKVACLFQLLSLVVASVIVVTPLDDHEVFFAGKSTLWTQSERLKLQIIYNGETKMNDLKEQVESFTIQLKNGANLNQHTVVNEHNLYQYPYSSSICSLILKTKKNVADYNQRILELDALLVKLKSSLPADLPEECFPKSAKQLARMINDPTEFRFNSPVTDQVELSSLSSPIISSDVNKVEFRRTQKSKTSITTSELLSSHSNVTEFLYAFNQSQRDTIRIQTITQLPHSLTNTSPSRPHSHVTTFDIYIEKSFNVYENYETEKIKDQVPIRYNLKMKERQITSNGLHRILKTSIELHDASDCNRNVVNLYEHFSTGVYVDIYELVELNRVNLLNNQSNVFSTLVYNDKVSVETSSLYSAPVYVKFSTRASIVNQSCVALFHVPIHFRYQEPGFSEFKKVIVNPPQTITVASVDDAYAELDVTDSDGFEFVERSVQVSRVSFDESVNGPIVIDIPIGQLKDQVMITNLTLGTTVICALILCVVSCASKVKKD